ncbi:hypothetical protein MASR1M8_00620 [Thermomonas brevis]
MPLSEEEIYLGTVAYFEPTVLHRDKDIEVTGDPVTRDGPFVCYAISEAKSKWTPLTSEDKFMTNRKTGESFSVRVRIRPEWVARAYGLFAAGESFFQDGKNTYSGANATFIAAAAKIDIQTPETRPALNEDGLKAARDYIARRGGAL